MASFSTQLPGTFPACSPGDPLPETFVEGFHDEETVRRMPFRAQRSGARMSALGLGSSAFGDVYARTSQSEVSAVVGCALAAGVNVVDSAYWYGQGKAEERLGVALQKVPRKAYYMNSKCGRYEKEVGRMFDFSAERTLRAVDDAIARLGCGYIDCMQIHDPEYATSVEVILEQTLPALQKAKDSGKIKKIGLTGYPLGIHKEILERSKVKIDSCLLYCHYSLNDTTLLDSGFLDYLETKNVDIINASPLSMGLLTAEGPPKWHPAPKVVKDTCAAAVRYCCEKKVNISKLAVNFSLREPRIPTTLVSTTDVNLFLENINTVLNFDKLSDLEKSVLSEIEEKYFAPLQSTTWEESNIADYKSLLGRAESGETDLGTLSTN